MICTEIVETESTFTRSGKGRRCDRAGYGSQDMDSNSSRERNLTQTEHGCRVREHAVCKEPGVAGLRSSVCAVVTRCSLTDLAEVAVVAWGLWLVRRDGSRGVMEVAFSVRCSQLKVRVEMDVYGKSYIEWSYIEWSETYSKLKGCKTMNLGTAKRTKLQCCKRVQ